MTEFDELLETKDTLRYSVPICLNGADYSRWLVLKAKAKKVVPNDKVTKFSRAFFLKFMDDLEQWLEEKSVADHP